MGARVVHAENKPRVSVCIPTYNYAHFLEQAVGSVLAQSFRDFELLVFDDISSDDTVEVMQQFLGDPRVKFQVNDVNQGLFANFNNIAKAAGGEYVKYLCADDWIEPQFLERTVALLDANPDLPLVTTANWLVDIGGNRFGAELQPYGDGPSIASAKVVETTTIGYNPIGMPSNTLIRREDLLAVGGFDAEFAPAADVHLYFKLLTRGDLGWIPENLTSIRIHSAHSHAYGNDPNDSLMRVWRAAPLFTDGLVTEQIARRGMQTEASRFVLFALKHAVKGRISRARELMATEREYFGGPRAAWYFARSFSGLVRDRLTTMRNGREGRYLLYTPRPARGDLKP